VQALGGDTGFRHIGVEHDEYAVSPDGMKRSLDLATEMEECRFSIGLRSSPDKRMRLVHGIRFFYFRFAELTKLQGQNVTSPPGIGVFAKPSGRVFSADSLSAHSTQHY
jgi:hypothetical protein